MALIPVKTPGIAKKMFSSYIWDLPTDEQVIYLTFDDGPTEIITPWVLEQLKSYNAKATFFVIGNNVDKHPDILQTVLEEGHTIGNHTYNHLKGWKTKTPVYLENIEACEAVLRIQNSRFKVSGAESDIRNSEVENRNLFRPPYGKLKPKQGKEVIKMGYQIVMWDVLSFDWDTSVQPETCYQNVISKATNGSIIVFHDSLKAAKNMQYALPKVLDYFNQKGFVFKSIRL